MNGEPHSAESCATCLNFYEVVALPVPASRGECRRYPWPRDNVSRDHWCYEHRAALNASGSFLKCPYCGRLADAKGGINHVAACIGLDNIAINRLQYDVLIASLKRK